MPISDQETATIDNYVDSCLHNPFDPLSSRPRRRAAQQLQLKDIRRLVVALVKNDWDKEAETLLLACGQYDVIQGDSPRAMKTGFLPEDIWKDLPKKSPEPYQAVVAAAARGYRAISRIMGSSDAMIGVRMRTWNACFGESLYTALLSPAWIRDHNILVLGETGTGKELVARAVQQSCIGPDAKCPPHETINAAEYPETLVESELFGHVKGAATGLIKSRKGAIRSADGGTFFLDEIGDLPKATQVKLLRVIEYDKVRPLGSDRPVKVSVRYVTATHRNLRELVAGGDFRRDLYERIAGSIIEIPPLRERSEDIPTIGEAFIKQKESHGDNIDYGEVNGWLKSNHAATLPWRGNVRELHNVIRSRVLGLPQELQRAARFPDPKEPTTEAAEAIPEEIQAAKWPERKVVDWYARRVVARMEGNKTRAAAKLEVNRTTLRRRLRRIES
jgi:DNA-binding NtrC family response regulator